MNPFIRTNTGCVNLEYIVEYSHRDGPEYEPFPGVKEKSKQTLIIMASGSRHISDQHFAQLQDDIDNYYMHKRELTDIEIRKNHEASQ